MKQFIYLDHDVVNSIIAQAENGIVLSILNEDSSSNSTDSETTTEVSANTKLSGSLLSVIKAEIGLGVGRKRNEGQTLGSASKDVVTKSLHDAAFDIAYAHITPLVIQNDDSDCDYGTFIELNRVFDYIDLDYIERLLSEEGLISYLKKTDKQKIEATATLLTDSANRNQFKKQQQEFKQAIKARIAANNAQYDDTRDIIKAFKQLIPYSRMLISHDGFLIPMDDTYFRINPCNLGFKYGGPMTCVGNITNLIGEDTKPIDDSNLFGTLQFYVNESLRALLPTKAKNIYVVHPLAVYYDSPSSNQEEP